MFRSYLFLLYAKFIHTNMMKKHNSNNETNLTRMAQLIVAPCWQKTSGIGREHAYWGGFSKRIDWEMGI